eukprot:TRINITY_DN8220_c0_g1_i1.p1 TRINITY_DN8220_c0_g1~~TRINITY_DN8220_c0_g1_i1.p1  ORF type:complete len:577 (+),score=100.56 TRINITY_DN8220_c0_g1_i1:2-1732(+)
MTQHQRAKSHLHHALHYAYTLVAWAYMSVIAFTQKLCSSIVNQSRTFVFGSWNSTIKFFRKTGQILYDDVYLLSCEIATDVLPHWFSTGIDSIAPRFIKEQKLKSCLSNAKTYEEWSASAKAVDKLLGHDTWKMSYECELYDYSLVRDHLDKLYRARKRDDKAAMARLLRTSLNRNLGGMDNDALYKHCLYGTKDLIEQYVDEVVYQLNYISVEQVPGLSLEEKISMFACIRQSYGRSALLLSGGGGLGVHHLGVLRVLWQQRLLPRVISGSSVGSLVAGVVCVTPDEELDQLLCGDTPALKSTSLITRDNEPDHFFAKLQHFFKHGTLADVEVLKEACRKNIGDITFQEAYNRTRRILNITINPPDATEAPRLLNYLTAPNVVVWSAACASCALSGLFSPVEVMAKDKFGRLHPWNPSGQTWSDGSMYTDLPMERLSELFNVNHFIVCQVNPHIVPFLNTKRFWYSGIMRVFASELTFRMDQLFSFGLLPLSLNNFRTVLKQKYTGDITIIPDVTTEDYSRIVSNPSPEAFVRAVRVGQLATWPKLAQIENHLKIELALDEIVHQLRGCERWSLQ